MEPRHIDYQPVNSGSLVKEVMERSGQNILACYQCKRCASGCTVGDETGFNTPDRLIRSILLDDKKAALSNTLVWQCVSCYTCGTRCPNDIQSGRITETLKKMSKEYNLAPLNYKVAYFHDSFIKGCTRWGRVNEMEFMGYYELKTIVKNLLRFKYKDALWEILHQIKMLFNMVKYGRMHLKFHSSTGRNEVQNLYKRALSKKRKHQNKNK